MNGRVDVATQKRRIQLLGPQRLAADLGERPVLHAVAGGGKGDKRDFAPAPAVRRGERISHHMRLRKRQRGGASAESDPWSRHCTCSRCNSAGRKHAKSSSAIILGIESRYDVRREGKKYASK